MNKIHRHGTDLKIKLLSDLKHLQIKNQISDSPIQDNTTYILKTSGKFKEQSKSVIKYIILFLFKIYRTMPQNFMTFLKPIVIKSLPRRFKVRLKSLLHTQDML